MTYNEDAYVHLVNWTHENCGDDWTTASILRWLDGMGEGAAVDSWMDYAESNADEVDNGPQLGVTTTRRYVCLDVFLQSLGQTRRRPEIMDTQRHDIDRSGESKRRSILMNHVTNAFAHGKLAVTDRELLGCIPLEAKEDDIVAVVRGLQLPMILRTTEEEGAYMVVGRAWFLGLGAGQAMESRLYQERDIVLV
jgi:hypothetical protein